MALKVEKKEKGLTWGMLNVELAKSTETQVQKMLADEKKGLGRRYWLIRIWGRYNRMRAQREMKELEESFKG